MCRPKVYFWKDCRHPIDLYHLIEFYLNKKVDVYWHCKSSVRRKITHPTKCKYWTEKPSPFMKKGKCDICPLKNEWEKEIEDYFQKKDNVLDVEEMNVVCAQAATEEVTKVKRESREFVQQQAEKERASVNSVSVDKSSTEKGSTLPAKEADENVPPATS